MINKIYRYKRDHSFKVIVTADNNDSITLKCISDKPPLDWKRKVIPQWYISPKTLHCLYEECVEKNDDRFYFFLKEILEHEQKT